MRPGRQEQKGGYTYIRVSGCGRTRSNGGEGWEEEVMGERRGYRGVLLVVGAVSGRATMEKNEKAERTRFASGRKTAEVYLKSQ